MGSPTLGGILGIPLLDRLVLALHNPGEGYIVLGDKVYHCQWAKEQMRPYSVVGFPRILNTVSSDASEKKKTKRGRR